jgi:hypothetical protein
MRLESFHVQRRANPVEVAALKREAADDVEATHQQFRRRFRRTEFERLPGDGYEHRILSAPELDQLCVNTIRALSIDAVQQAKSGHPGNSRGARTAVYNMWNRLLRFEFT